MSGQQRAGRRPRRWGRALLGAGVAGVYLFLMAPVVVVVLLSFGENISIVSLSGLSTLWYERLFEDETVLTALWFSFKVGVASALAAGIVGSLAALALVRYRFRGSAAIRALIFSPMIVPEIIIAVALLSFFAFLSIPRGFVALVIGHGLLALPYVVATVSARLYGFDRSLEEAARNLGASPLRVMAEVTLPLITPAIVAAVLIAFKVSFDEIVGSLFWSSAREQTLPVIVFGMVQYEVTPQVNAVGTLMIAVTLSVLAVVELLRLRRRGT